LKNYSLKTINNGRCPYFYIVETHKGLKKVKVSSKENILMMK